MRQIFMERHSKGEFHVLVKELKLFHHESLFNNLLHSAISLADNTIE